MYGNGNEMPVVIKPYKDWSSYISKRKKSPPDPE